HAEEVADDLIDDDAPVVVLAGELAVAPRRPGAGNKEHDRRCKQPRPAEPEKDISEGDGCDGAGGTPPDPPVAGAKERRDGSDERRLLRRGGSAARGGGHRLALRARMISTCPSAW